eukprot:m.143579 g.143579  ORF g.143579 m.143579 type:complete len:911 (-) comp16742_c4_seq2:1552-4284(-)
MSAPFDGHRPGGLKQQNKSHKSKHRSKSQLAVEAGGRVGGGGVKAAGAAGHTAEQRREQRRLQAVQQRQKKRAAAHHEKRSVGAAGAPPLLVILVDLSDSSSSDSSGSATWLRELLIRNAYGDDAAQADALKAACAQTPTSPVTFQHHKLRARATLVACPQGDLLALADLAKLADVVLFVQRAAASASPAPLGTFGQQAMSLLYAQGVPTVALAVSGLGEVPAKRATEAKKVFGKAAEALNVDCRVFYVDGETDAGTLFWSLASIKRRHIAWRDARGHLLADAIAAEPLPTADPEKGPRCTLRVTGYIRGTHGISANRLVYLPGCGGFQIDRIEAAADPCAAGRARKHDAEMGTAEGAVLAARDEALAEPLQMSVPLDPMAGEQTWPTEEELDEAEREQQQARKAAKAAKAAKATTNGAAKGKTKKSLDDEGGDAGSDGMAEDDDNDNGNDNGDDAGGEMDTADKAARTGRTVKVPKGWSSYQAAWIPESDGEGDDGEDDDDEDGEDGEDAAMHDGDDDDGDEEDGGEGKRAVHFLSDDDEVDRVSVTNADEDRARRYDDEQNDAEDETAYRSFRRRAREDQAFPDEVDTPLDKPARVRFAKYRGLQSFRTSPWDPKEELPEDYARIFQFENFNRTKKRALTPDDSQPGWVSAGQYVTLVIANVPAAFAEAAQQRRVPLGVFSLLSHENKMSVCHYRIRMLDSCTEPIKSKDTLIFSTGIRCYATNPIFSQPTLSSKHKFERYWQPGTITVATCFAPIHFPPAPVLVFREVGPADIRLVGTGSMMAVDPDRLIIKRIRLSGHPYKINKRSAVIRYMFFNPDDIYWFKPVELVTKYGRRGHIKESLGTHGHMKCIFDGQLKADDTVLLSLYKRVYPKWVYEETYLPRYTLHMPASLNPEDDVDEGDMQEDN